MIARLFRIVALWWRSRRWVACRECGVTLTPDEEWAWRQSGGCYCDECRETVPPVPALPEFRPGMVNPYPRCHALTYSTHDYRIAYFE